MIDAAVRFREGLAAHQGGRLDEAERACAEVLAQDPGHVDALHLLGLIARQRRDHRRAVELIGEALRLKPDNPTACVNLGKTQREMGRPEAGLASHEQALALSPDLVEALCGRAACLADLGRTPEAVESYGRAIAVRPDLFEALNNRGNLLQAQGRLDEALADYDRALAARPDLLPALNNRGAVLRKLGRMEEALASFDRAVALRPDSAELWNNRANTLRRLGRFQAAAECYRSILRLDPGFRFALGNLQHCLSELCDWGGREERVGMIVAGARAGRPVDTPLPFLALSDSAADQLACARASIALEAGAGGKASPAPRDHGHDRLRIGYVSGDFHEHIVAHVLAGLFEAHDRERFTVTGVSLGPDVQDAMRSRLMAAFDDFLDARGLDDAQTAALIREREIDILVDLSGFTEGGRPAIFSHRPAPVQASYLGYPGTMGADWWDYILADATVIPPDHEEFYAEKVVRLPGCYLVNTARPPAAEPAPTRESLGLPSEGFVFCAFHSPHKINPALFEVWTRLLAAAQGSVLWLRESRPEVLANLRAAAAARGIAPERLVFAPHEPTDRHLARLALADLFLDAAPYNAHATASEALWAGLPVLTLLGGAFSGRVAASLLRAAGLPELIAETLEDYEAAALALAQSPDRLASLKAWLSRRREQSPLFDTDRLRRHLEAAYLAMHERARRGLPPESFDVQPL